MRESREMAGTGVNSVPAQGAAVLREIEALSKRMFLPIIGPVKGEYLAWCVREFDVKSVLEVGTLVGYSAILISGNLPADGKLATIEINPGSGNLARENIRRAGLAGKVDVYVGNAINVLPRIDGIFDMVFLDATKREYLEYLRLSEKKLMKGGVVFADNVKIFAREMRDYLDYVRNSHGYSSRYIDAGFDGVEISIKLF